MSRIAPRFSLRRRTDAFKAKGALRVEGVVFRRNRLCHRIFENRSCLARREQSCAEPLCQTLRFGSLAPKSKKHAAAKTTRRVASHARQANPKRHEHPRISIRQHLGRPGAPSWSVPTKTIAAFGRRLKDFRRFDFTSACHKRNRGVRRVALHSFAFDCGSLPLNRVIAAQSEVKRSAI